MEEINSAMIEFIELDNAVLNWGRSLLSPGDILQCVEIIVCCHNLVEMGDLATGIS